MFVVGCLISHLRRSISQLIGGLNLKNMRIITPFIGKTTAYIRPPTTQFSWPIDPNFVCGILQLAALRLSLSGHLQILAPRLRRLSSLALEQEETHGNPGGPKGFSRILALKTCFKTSYLGFTSLLDKMIFGSKNLKTWHAPETMYIRQVDGGLLCVREVTPTSQVCCKQLEPLVVHKIAVRNITISLNHRTRWAIYSKL